MYPNQGPSAPSNYPPYPPSSTPSAPPQNYPSYPPPQNPYPQQPTYPPQQPTYPSQQPTYPPYQSTYPPSYTQQTYPQGYGPSNTLPPPFPPPYPAQQPYPSYPSPTPTQTYPTPTQTYPPYSQQPVSVISPSGQPVYVSQTNGSTIFQQNMRYQIREKWFSLGGDCAIRDGNGYEAFRVKGEPFSWGFQLSFRDAYSNKELAYVHQKLRLGLPHFEIYRNGTLYATIKQRFSLSEYKFEVDMASPISGQDLIVKGDWWGLEFEFWRGGRLAATVSKRFFTVTDTYGVDIVAGEDNILLLAAATVIEKACHDHRQSNPHLTFGGYHYHHHHNFHFGGGHHHHFHHRHHHHRHHGGLHIRF